MPLSAKNTIYAALSKPYTQTCSILEEKLREDELKNPKSDLQRQRKAASESNYAASFAISQIILTIYRWRVCKGKYNVG